MPLKRCSNHYDDLTLYFARDDPSRARDDLHHSLARDDLNHSLARDDLKTTKRPPKYSYSWSMGEEILDKIEGE